MAWLLIVRLPLNDSALVTMLQSLATGACGQLCKLSIVSELLDESHVILTYACIEPGAARLLFVDYVAGLQTEAWMRHVLQSQSRLPAIEAIHHPV